MDETPQLKPWSAYYEAHAGRAPFRFLEDAIKLVPGRDAALDLGAGPLNETKALLERGFGSVVALDREAEVADRAATLGDPRVKAEIASFDRYAFPKESFDLVVATKALPFAGKHLAEVVKQVARTLKPGGIFVGNLFGTRHAFNSDASTSLCFCSAAEAQALLRDFEIVQFEEVERDEQTKDGIKHWHQFDFIVRKK